PLCRLSSCPPRRSSDLVFILTVIAGLAVLITVVLLPVVALVARLGAWRYLRAIRASLLMAFSTTSSLATLPVMLEAAEHDGEGGDRKSTRLNSSHVSIS